MLFDSYPFLLGFLPVALAAYALLRRLADPRPLLAALLVLSLAFYAAWDWRFLPLLLLSIAGNRAVAARMDRAPSRRARRAWLLAGLALDLGGLFAFKYAAFAAGLLRSLTGWPGEVPPLPLPLGISFFTLQQIAYLVDLHRGAPVDRDPLRYPLFVAFFPHLIAGPLIHHGEYARQLARLRERPLASDLAVGGSILAVGLAKKVLLADGLAPFADPVFAAAAGGSRPGLAAAWLAVLAWSLQLYFDFSGYSDMAIGLGRMFGIVFPLNFASPYRATSVVDFWRRWHITLSRFLREYLYIPLGGNRRGRPRQYLNLLLTMLLGGLWHGAGLAFLLWGGLHGVMLAANHLWRARPGHRPLPAAVAWPLTFLAVTLVWVPFRAASVAAALRVWSGLAGLGGPAAPVPAAGAALAAGCLAIATLGPNTQTLLRHYAPGLPTPGYATGIPPEPARRAAPAWQPSPGWAALAGLLVAASLMGLNGVSEFVYFRF